MQRLIYDILAWAIVIAVTAAATMIIGNAGIFDAIEKLYL